MRWIRWSPLAMLALVTAVLAAGPSAQAHSGDHAPRIRRAAPVLALPQAQLPAGLIVAAGAGPQGGLETSMPAMVSPTVARARLKAFVSEAYSRGTVTWIDGVGADGGIGADVAGAPTEDQPPLAEILATIDALSPTQVQVLDERLGPVIWASRALAARPSPARDPYGASPNQSTDPEVLRQDLDTYFARLEPYAHLAGPNAAVYTRLVTEMRQATAGLTEEELLGLLDMFALVPSARSVLAVDPGTLVGALPPGGSAAASAEAHDGVGPAGLQASVIHTTSSCSDMAFGPVATAVLTAVANAANDIAGLLSDDYMATTFNIKEIPQLIAKSIALPLQLVALAAETDTNYFVNCHEGAHQVLFGEHDEEMTNRTEAIASLLSDSDKQSDLERILANRMDRLDTFNAEQRRLTLRLAIEKDLVRHGDPRIAFFQVPNSMCVTVGEHQNCGQLDTVREIVADTILMNRSLGFDTTLATEVFEDGENQQALGLYKAAYTRYRYAYQLAVRSEQ